MTLFYTAVGKQLEHLVRCEWGWIMSKHGVGFLMALYCVAAYSQIVAAFCTCSSTLNQCGIAAVFVMIKSYFYQKGHGYNYDGHAD